MLPLFAFLAYQCDDANFVDSPPEPKSGMRVEMTLHGLSHYLNMNAQNALFALLMLKIPPMNFEVLSFRLDFTDFRVYAVNVPKVGVEFTDQGYLQGQLEINNMVLHLRFTLQQTIYPYLYDSGNAEIKLKGLSLTFNMWPLLSPQCKNHMNIAVSNVGTYVNSLQIHFNSDMAFIYDSIMAILTGLIVETFNSQIGPQLVYQLVDIANQGLNEDTGVVTSDYVDQRNIKLFISDEFYGDYVSGQMVKFDPETRIATGFNQMPIVSQPKRFTNAQIQYHLHKVVLQSNFDYVYNWTAPKDLGLASIPQVQNITNTGVIVRFAFADAQAPETPSYQADYLFAVESSTRYKSMTINVSQFIMQSKTVLSCTGSAEQCLHAGSVVDAYNKQLQSYRPQYMNGNGIKECTTLYQPFDWVSFSCAYFDKFDPPIPTHGGIILDDFSSE